MSIYTLEVAGKAAACISADSQAEAEETIDNPWFRDAMLGIEGNGPPLWDGLSEWRLRKPTEAELAALQDNIAPSGKSVEDQLVTVLLSQPAQTPADHTLILANRVEHTPVFNEAGERIGHIADLSIDKVSGQVIYAIMSFGGFLGMGAKFHPLPWALLKYDRGRNGYVVHLDGQALKNAPHYEPSQLSEFGGPDFDDVREAVYRYYGQFGGFPF